MDYTPANISPNGTTQGYFYTPTIGPYDYWAIEYGYKEFSGSEATELEKVAARCSDPGLQYATDEDVVFGSDPLVNRFDLGHDPMNFASRQMKLSTELMPKLAQMTDQHFFKLKAGMIGADGYPHVIFPGACAPPR